MHRFTSFLDSIEHDFIRIWKSETVNTLDANFVQRWQKCQICVIYENIDWK